MRRLALTLGLLATMLVAGAVGPAGALAVVPVVVTGGATSIAANSATVAGTVTPVGLSTDYSFEYGTSTSYGQQTASQSAGSVLTPVPVTASITMLTPATTYHYRVVATNSSGTTLGLDQTFTTTSNPTAVTGPAIAVTGTTATITGSVNPHGVPTSYSVGYGTTTASGQGSSPQPAGSGAVDVPVAVNLTGLTPATTYHYSVNATYQAAADVFLTVSGADMTFMTAGTPAASTLAVAVNPAGGNTDLATTVNLGLDPAGTPVGAASVIAEALPAQFTNQLASFGTCPAASFKNVQGPTAANCPDRASILGVGTLVTRSDFGAIVTSDQGFVVRTAANQVVFWWHKPAIGVTPAGFGQAPGLVSQETGTAYGPLVTYDFTGLGAGLRIKQVVLDYQPNAAAGGKAPFAATACTGGSWTFQARIIKLGGAAPELPTTTVPCGTAPQPSKLQVARATIFPVERVIDILAPISRRASGSVSLELYAAGQRHRWTAAINSADGRIRTRESIPAAQAKLGTGILTITYGGNAETRPQVVRLRAANVPAQLDAARPTLDSTGHLSAHGTLSDRARGVVRVQLEYYSGGKTTTLQYFAHISGGVWSLASTLTASQQAAIAKRQGTVHSYILYTGYLPQRMRGEMVSYQVLGAP